MRRTRSITVCSGNFCRRRGATLQAFEEVAETVGADLHRAQCSGFCMFGPVVCVADDAGARRMLFQIDGERAQILLDSLRGCDPVNMPQFPA